MVAIDDPALVDRKVFFNVSGHGYEYPADGFGIRGVALEVKPGETAQIKVKRIEHCRAAVSSDRRRNL